MLALITYVNQAQGYGIMRTHSGYQKVTLEFLSAHGISLSNPYPNVIIELT